jgi:hypothetical protein
MFYFCSPNYKDKMGSGGSTVHSALDSGATILVSSGLGNVLEVLSRFWILRMHTVQQTATAVNLKSLDGYGPSIKQPSD